MFITTIFQIVHPNRHYIRGVECFFLHLSIDRVVVGFMETALTVSESAGLITAMVVINRISDVPVTVDVAIIPGTATEEGLLCEGRK